MCLGECVGGSPSWGVWPSRIGEDADGSKLCMPVALSHTWRVPASPWFVTQRTMLTSAGSRVAATSADGAPPPLPGTAAVTAATAAAMAATAPSSPACGGLRPADEGGRPRDCVHCASCRGCSVLQEWWSPAGCAQGRTARSASTAHAWLTRRLMVLCCCRVQHVRRQWRRSVCDGSPYRLDRCRRCRFAPGRYAARKNCDRVLLALGSNAVCNSAAVAIFLFPFYIPDADQGLPCTHALVT